MRGWRIWRRKKKCGGRLLHGEEREREREWREKSSETLRLRSFLIIAIVPRWVPPVDNGRHSFFVVEERTLPSCPSFSFFSCRSVSIFPPLLLPCLLSFFFFLFFFCYLLSGQSWVAILSIVPGHRLENRAHKASIVGHRLVHALICFHSPSLSLSLSLSVCLSLVRSSKTTSWSVDKEGRKRKSRWSTIAAVELRGKTKLFGFHYAISILDNSSWNE